MTEQFFWEFLAKFVQVSGFRNSKELREDGASNAWRFSVAVSHGFFLKFPRRATLQSV